MLPHQSFMFLQKFLQLVVVVGIILISQAKLLSKVGNQVLQIGDHIVMMGFRSSGSPFSPGLSTGSAASKCAASAGVSGRPSP